MIPLSGWLLSSPLLTLAGRRTLTVIVEIEPAGVVGVDS